MALLGIPGTVHAIPVLHGFDVEVEDRHSPGMTDPEFIRKHDLCLRAGRAFVEQNERTGGRRTGENTEIDPTRDSRRAEWKRTTHPQVVAVVVVRRIDVNCLKAHMRYACTANSAPSSVS